jgi:hypothetical protein
MVNVRYLIAAKTKTKTRTVNYQLSTINYHFIPCPNENLFIR